MTYCFLVLRSPWFFPYFRLVIVTASQLQCQTKLDYVISLDKLSLAAKQMQCSTSHDLVLHFNDTKPDKGGAGRYDLGSRDFSAILLSNSSVLFKKSDSGQKHITETWCETHD